MTTWRARTTAALSACLLLAALTGCDGGQKPEAAQSAQSAPSARESPSPTISASEPSPSEGAPSSGSASNPSRADLDAFVEQGRQALKSMLSPALKKTYSDIRIEPDYPSGIVYTYVFRHQVDPKAGATQLAKSAPLLKKSFSTSVAPALEAQGFADPTVTWAYVNPDGSLIWSRTFR